MHWKRFTIVYGFCYTNGPLAMEKSCRKPNRSNTMGRVRSVFWMEYWKVWGQVETTNASWSTCHSNLPNNQSTIAIRHMFLHATIVDTPTWRTNMLQKSLLHLTITKKCLKPVRMDCHAKNSHCFTLLLLLVPLPATHPTNKCWLILPPLPATPHTTSDRFKSANQTSLLNQLQPFFDFILNFIFCQFLVCYPMVISREPSVKF